MLKGLFRVLSQGEKTYTYEAELENGKSAMCSIKLQEFGGDVNCNEFVCTLFDDLAEQRFNKGDLVAASLRFRISNYINSEGYQFVEVKDIQRI